MSRSGRSSRSCKKNYVMRNNEANGAHTIVVKARTEVGCRIGLCIGRYQG